MALPVDRFLNAIYVWCLKRVDPEKVDQWLHQLSLPIPGRVETVDVEAEMNDFDAFAAAFGVRPPVASG